MLLIRPGCALGAVCGGVVDVGDVGDDVDVGVLMVMGCRLCCCSDRWW